MRLFQDKDFNKKLYSLVIPIAFQQFMINLMSVSDAVMLGTIGQSKLSAVSLAGQVQFVLSLFLAAITIGTSIFAAQYYGKKDFCSIEKVFAMALQFTFLISLLFTLATALFPNIIMGLFTSDGVLISYGARYLRIASPSYLLCGISQVYLCIMKNCGNAHKSTIISAICVVLDALMNAILIFGLLGFPQMDIAGAALSTTIAKLLETCWSILSLYRQKEIQLRPHYLFHTDRELLKKFWKYTFPVLGNEIVWGVGFTMTAVIMGHLGDDATAANSIANITKNLAVCFCIGIASGGGILIGNELGAGNLTTAKNYGQKLCQLAVLFGIISGIIILILSPLILRFVSLTDISQSYLKRMLLICSYYVIGKSINCTTIAGIFCAGGDSRFGFLCDTIVMWCIIVPLGFLSAFVWKLPVTLVYFLICLDEFLKIPAVYKHYKKYIWVKNLTIKENKL